MRVMPCFLAVSFLAGLILSGWERPRIGAGPFDPAGKVSALEAESSVDGEARPPLSAAARVESEGGSPPVACAPLLSVASSEEAREEEEAWEDAIDALGALARADTPQAAGANRALLAIASPGNLLEKRQLAIALLHFSLLDGEGLRALRGFLVEDGAEEGADEIPYAAVHCLSQAGPDARATAMLQEAFPSVPTLRVRREIVTALAEQAMAGAAAPRVALESLSGQGCGLDGEIEIYVESCDDLSRARSAPGSDRGGEGGEDR